MLSAARWAVIGLLAVSVLTLAFAFGYVARGDGGSDDPPPASQDAPQDNGDPGDVALTDTDFDNLNQIYELLEDKYVEPDFVDRETLYQAAINGLLQSFPDTGTFYVDPVTVQTSTGPSGTFEGIGATVADQDGEIVIVAPIEDTPAERAGLLAGDVILEVDGESTDGWTQEKAVIRIRGPRGTTVTLRVRHLDGVEEVLEIERDEIRVESVTTQPPGGALEDGSGTEITDIAYIHIREFNEPTTDEVKAVLEEAVDSGKRGVVLDLRNNPGGLLRTTIEVADEFLEDDVVILSERERNGDEQSFTARDGGAATDIPVVILQNRFSASGSEVLAAALRDNGRATIVGEKSFGKGTVNQANALGDGGQLYVSIAKWLTPNGTQIDGVGLRPDIEVILSDEDIDLRRDVQLHKAVDLLRGTDTAVVSTPPASSPTPEGTPEQPGG
jgi:carboxyl-terminal processing protease